MIFSKAKTATEFKADVVELFDHELKARENELRMRSKLGKRAQDERRQAMAAIAYMREMIANVNLMDEVE